jgi:hypothetical protein
MLRQETRMYPALGRIGALFNCHTKSKHRKLLYVFARGDCLAGSR